MTAARPVRVEFLMDSEELRLLRALARQRKTSMADLMRTAVRGKYLTPSQPDRKALVDSILRMGLPDMDWEKVRAEIEDAHAAAE